MSTSSDSSDPRQELASTYMVPDRSNEEEIARLQVQERLLTSSTGGVLAEQSEPDSFGRVLDVGCGPGGWLIETAQTYPKLSLLVGIDINGKMLNIARERAKALQVDSRVEFHMMDALRMLEFPNAYFGLVNQRAGISWLRKWDWLKLLQEYQRVLYASGILRITEVNGALESNSPALIRLWNLGAEAFYQAGISFSLTGDNLGGILADLLKQYGWQHVQMRTYTLEYRPNTIEGQLFIEDMKRLFRTFKPFLEKWLRLPDDYAEIYQQMLKECAQPDFVATAKLFTIWGTNQL
jgi:ubiquinone/menaquinone biosynthesis C-methylase UbiE